MTNHPTHNAPPDSRPPQRLHLWEITFVRDLFWIGVIVAIVAAVYHLRRLVLPVFIGALLAYICHPLITWARRKWHIPRPLGAGILLFVCVASLLAFLAWLGPTVNEQASQFIDRAPRYYEKITGRSADDVLDLSKEWKGAMNRMAETPYSSVKKAFRGGGRVLDILGTVLATAAYLGMAILLIPLVYFVFAWHFDRVSEARKFIPRNHRDRVVDLVHKIDSAFAGFFRGRLFVALIIGVLSAIGWAIVGVPYWFLVAAITAIVSLVPYGTVIGWVLAVGLMYLESTTNSSAASWIDILVWPTVVYAAVQAFEGWIITPWVQGHSTHLHWLTIILVVLIGGNVAGLFGMIFAIPVTASLKVLAVELVLPRARRRAERAGSGAQ